MVFVALDTSWNPSDIYQPSLNSFRLYYISLPTRGAIFMACLHEQSAHFDKICNKRNSTRIEYLSSYAFTFEVVSTKDLYRLQQYRGFDFDFYLLGHIREGRELFREISKK